MTSKFLSLVAGVSALALAGAAQAQPLQLTDAQMDGVTAGSITKKHVQLIKIDVKADVDIKDDIAKSVAAAQATGPSSYNAFTFTDTFAAVDRTKYNVTSVSTSESVAGLSRISVKRY
jgi:hypothetical protein